MWLCSFFHSSMKSDDGYQIRRVIYIVRNPFCTTGHVLSKESAGKYIPVIICISDWPPHLLPWTSVPATSGSGSRVNRVSGTNGTSVISWIPGLSRMFAHLTGNITCHCRPYTSSLSMYRRWRLLTPYRRLFSGSNARIVNKVGSRA